MAKCAYCGAPAGFLKTFHPRCRAEADDRAAKARAAAEHSAGALRVARNSIIALGTAAALGKEPLDSLDAKVRETASPAALDDAEFRPLLAKGWRSAVVAALEDGALSETEEAFLAAYRTQYDFSQAELGEELSSVVKAAAIRDVLEGRVPSRIDLRGPVPFNVQRGETIVWLWPQTTFYEERTTTRYEGRSAGVSVRIARGLYYRTSAFRGHSVRTSGMTPIDTGAFGVTTKHLYFSGTSKGFRIALTKVAAFTPYSDGIGVQREASTARPQAFVNGDGWFTFNLVTNLGRL